MPKRLLQIVVVCLAAITMMGAGTPATRFNSLGHQLMCTCSCTEILLECNHMGCPDSPGIIADLHVKVDAGGTDKSILGWFADKYGPIVLASPMRDGFDRVAWIVPFVVLGLGILGVVVLVRLWHGRQRALHLNTAGGPAAIQDAMPDSMRDRIRRETTFEP